MRISLFIILLVGCGCETDPPGLEVNTTIEDAITVNAGIEFRSMTPEEITEFLMMIDGALTLSDAKGKVRGTEHQIVLDNILMSLYDDNDVMEAILESIKKAL